MVSRHWYQGFKTVLTIAGPGYRSEKVFNLAKMQPYTLTDLLYHFRLSTEDIALYLPRTSDIRQLANESLAGSKMTVIHYCMEGASKVGRSPIRDYPFLTKGNRRSARTTVVLHFT